MRALRIGIGGHPAYAAAVCAFAVDALYLALIAHQENGGSRVGFVAASLAAAGVAAGAGEIPDLPAGGLVGAWAAATLWIWVLLASLSIGILVVPAAIFATISLRCRPAHPFAIGAGIALALLIAVAGLVWTG
jgi:hypothetical protein